MPRTIWSGAISFGLVTVPCHVQSATENHSIQFHQYHLEDMGRVRVRKVCELEDREVAQAEIGKGYEYAKDQVVAISDEELRELPLPTAKAIEIQAFVPLESIDPIRIGDGYYLTPDGQVAAKPYKLLVQALGRSSKVAIAKYAWSGRKRLGLLRVREDAIVLHAMRWPDEVRDPAAVDPPHEQVSDEEIDRALALMESMSRDDLDGPEVEPPSTTSWASSKRRPRSVANLASRAASGSREPRPVPPHPHLRRPPGDAGLVAAGVDGARPAAGVGGLVGRPAGCADHPGRRGDGHRVDDLAVGHVAVCHPGGMSRELRPSIVAPRPEELAAVLKRVRAELRQGQPDIHQGGRKSPSRLLQSR